MREARGLNIQEENYLLPATTNVFRASQSMIFTRGPQRRGIGASQQHPFFTPLIHVTRFLGCHAMVKMDLETRC